MERKSNITLKLAALIFLAFSVAAICAGIFLSHTLFGNAISNTTSTQAANELTRDQQALVSLSNGDRFKYTDMVTNETGETDMLYVACPNSNKVTYDVSYTDFSNLFYVYGDDGSGGAIDHNYKCEVVNKNHYVTHPIVSLDVDMNKYVFTCGNLITITLDANGGYFNKNANTITKQGVAGMEFRLENIPTRTNYIFKGYNTKQDGTGSYINVISSLPDESFTLFAQWESADATPSITFDSAGTGNFSVYIYKFDSGWQDVAKITDTAHYEYNIPDGITPTSDMQYSYFQIAYNASGRPEQEVSAHSPVCLGVNLRDENNVDYALYVFAESKEGKLINNCLHNSTLIKPCAYSVYTHLAGAHNFSLTISEKQDSIISFSSDKNLLLRVIDLILMPAYSFSSKLEIDLKKEDVLLFTFCPMGRASEYFSGITDGCIEIEVYSYDSDNNTYIPSRGFLIIGYVYDINNPSLINKIAGMEYAGEICNVQTDWAYICDGEHNNVNLLTTGGGYSVSSKFDANGGKFSDGDESKEIEQTTGVNLILPDEDPSIDGEYFDGWYTAPEGGQLINLESYPWDPKDVSSPWYSEENSEANVYYAHWTTTPPGPVPPDPPGPDPDPEPIPVVDPTEDVPPEFFVETAQTSDHNALIVFCLISCFIGSFILVRKSIK